MEKTAAWGSRLWDTDPREEDCVAAVVERQSHRFLSRACAFAIVCFTGPGRGLVIRFTRDCSLSAMGISGEETTGSDHRGER